MKKIISFLLAVVLLVSAVPVACAAETTDYTNGTAVAYTATGAEAYTVNVPAQLAPGGSGTVTLEGTWASDRVVSVTADKNVILTNSINAADQKALNVSFPGIDEYGSNTTSQTFTETVSVAGISDALFGTWSGRFYYNVAVYDVVEYLQVKYPFDYYSTMNLAVTDVNNGAIGASADIAKENKADAVVGIYTDENGGVNVVLLKDYTETARIQPAADMTINLGGHILTFENDYFGIDCKGNNNITIDGQLSGSQMVLNGIDGGGALISVRNTTTVVINGGTYTINETVANEYYPAVAVSVDIGGIAFISNSNIKAYSNYNSQNGKYSEHSIGISNYGTTTISDCYVMGTHSGISNHDTLYVNGGTYEGYGHGGFYFSNTGKTAYVQNATIRECAMPDGYTANLLSNHSGFYIGGATGRDNISVYMDNCDIYGSSQPIVLRGTDGEKNNSLYISNSKINQDYSRFGIRIDNDSYRLYIGQNCNFDISDCAIHQIQFDLSTVVFETDEIYIMN